MLYTHPFNKIQMHIPDHIFWGKKPLLLGRGQKSTYLPRTFKKGEITGRGWGGGSMEHTS